MNLDKISGLEKLSFGLGDFAANGVFTFVSSYLLFFYTDIAGVSLKTAGVLLLLGRSVDAITSVIAGCLIDKTDTRLGKCRPYLFISTIPLMSLLCLLFLNIEAGATNKVFLMSIMYLVFSIFYAFYNVPYSTMLSLISSKHNDRITFNVFKNFGANAGALFVTALSVTLIGFCGGEQQNGYFKTAFIYSIIFFVAATLCFLFTKERVKRVERDKLSLLQSFQISKKNHKWILFVIIQFVAMFYMILHNQSTFYYTKYYLGDERLTAIILSLTPVMCILSALLLPVITKRYQMNHILMIGHLIVFFSLIVTFLCERYVFGVLICSIFTSFGWSIATGLIFVMHAQHIDETERLNGIRPQGFMTSCMTFLMKAGVAFAGIVSPIILKEGGYRPNMRMDGKTLFAINMNYSFLPCILSFLVVLLCLFYKNGYQPIKNNKMFEFLKR